MVRPNFETIAYSVGPYPLSIIVVELAVTKGCIIFRVFVLPTIVVLTIYVSVSTTVAGSEYQILDRLKLQVNRYRIAVLRKLDHWRPPRFVQLGF